MFERRKMAGSLGERDIFGDEEAAAVHAELDVMRHEIHDLRAQLNAQFTTIAAHAEIAREQSRVAREEARADLDRTRDTLIGLIESVRGQTRATGRVSGPTLAAPVTQPIEALERMIADVAHAVERCHLRQNELADAMASFLDTMVADRRDQPVAGLSLV